MYSTIFETMPSNSKTQTPYIFFVVFLRTKMKYFAKTDSPADPVMYV
jgi:hypothetical protein